MRLPNGFCRKALHLTAGLVVALTSSWQVYAEPVMSPQPTQAATSPPDSPPWVIDSTDLAADFVEPKDSAGAAAQGAPAASPAQQRPERARAQTLLPTPQNFSQQANVPAARDDPSWNQELRGNLKETVRPTYNELKDSLHSLQAELGLDAAPSQQESLWGGSPAAGHTADASTNPWENPSGRTPSLEPPRSAAQIENDKIMASFMVTKLIDEVKPWALGLFALYVVGYLVKWLLAYSQFKATRKVKRQTERALRKHNLG